MKTSSKQRKETLFGFPVDVDPVLKAGEIVLGGALRKLPPVVLDYFCDRGHGMLLTGDRQPNNSERCPVCRLRDEALKVVATLYVAMHREGWEEGPTINEATDTAHDWFYRTFGHDLGAACDAIPAALKPAKRGKKR